MQAVLHMTNERNKSIAADRRYLITSFPLVYSADQSPHAGGEKKRHLLFAAPNLE
jgi:hypothetical protein